MPTKRVYTIPGLQQALRGLPKELSAELRVAATDIAADIARESRARLGRTDQGELVARSIRSRRDRKPVVMAGGDTLLPRRASGSRKGRLTNGLAGPRNPVNQTVGSVFFGANFGSRRYGQFPRVKRPDWGLYAAIEDMGDEIMERYGDALAKALAKL